MTEKIKALFQFIDFLHSNINNFNQYNGIIEEFEALRQKRSKLNKKGNYKDKLEYDKIQVKGKSKLKIIEENIIKPIKLKATELNVCNFNKDPLHSFNGVELDIHNIKESFTNEDVKEILNYKDKYIKYRKHTHNNYITLAFFYSDLDEILKSLFDFFKDTKKNEFEDFETKTIEVNNIEELAKQISIKEKERYKTKYEIKKYKLNELQASSIEPEPPLKEKKQTEQNKIPAKFYALYHWLLIEMGTEKPFERNTDDKFSKKEIEAFAKERYPNISTQGFYRNFIDIQLTDKIRIARNFGKGYKEKIITISKNSAKIIKHLQKYPN